MKLKSGILWILCALAAAAVSGRPRAAAQAPPQVVEARKLIAEKKFAEAEKVLADFVRERPQAPMAWLLLGTARQAQQQWDSALEALDRAATFGPVSAQAHYNRACIFSRRTQIDKAFDALRQAVEAGFADRDLLKTDTDLDSLRTDPRFARILPPTLTGAAAFVEPTRVLRTWDGEAAQDQFGWVFCKVGDLDGDRAIDIAVTAPSSGGGKGKLYVYSSRTGRLLFESVGEPGSGLGNGVGSVGDLDRDGVADVGVCGPGGVGVARILSGRSGRLIREVKGVAAGERFGNKIAGIGDIDRDGVPDFVVTAPAGDSTKGACIGFSGRSGTPLFRLSGESAGDQFGSAVAGYSKGKQALLAVGAQDAGDGDRGKVYVYDLSSGQPLLRFTVDPEADSRDLGQMFVAFPGDFNQDGVPDIYCSDFTYGKGGSGVGQVLVVSGKDGKRLLTLVGKQPGENLGTSLSDAGDTNGDGVPDLIVGAWQNAEGSRSGGKCTLFSGAGGTVLRTWTCKQAGDTLGFDSMGVGDIDGDGRIDFALSSAWSNVKGPKTGRVFLVSGAR